jgi:hypothetical protein
LNFYFLVKFTSQEGTYILKNTTPKIWDLVNKFEEWVVEEKGWNINRFYDLIEVEDEYYKFYWTRDFHPQTFKKILARQSCSLGEHLSYKTVRPSYMAWILYEAPSISIWKIIKETPKFSRKVALYDLSEAFKGEPNCLKLNETETPVLEEFEMFLNREYGINLKPFFETLTSAQTNRRIKMQ